jgi:hypothetical protein
MACAVKHQAALLLGCLGWYEPHVGSGNRLANRLCVRCIVLLTLDVGLHVSWRASAGRYGRAPEARGTNSETRHRPQCQPGMVAPSGRTQGHGGASTAGGPIPGWRHQLRAPGRLTWRCPNRLSWPSGWLAPLNNGSFNSAHIGGTHVPMEEPSTASKADFVPTFPARQLRTNRAHGHLSPATRVRFVGA